MKTNDLYRVTEGFIPFYKIPSGALAQVYTWMGFSRGVEHYSSNIVRKYNDHIASLSGELNSQPTLQANIDLFLDPNDLVKPV